MATAKDVAGYLVNGFISIGKPITNMKLQKLLYYSWIKYYKKENNYLFKDKFSAWKLGPVIRDVYNEYRRFAAMPIFFDDEKKFDIDPDVALFLNDIVKEYQDVSAFKLVSMTHEDGKPWKKIYVPDKSMEIPFDLIIRLECS